METPKTRYARSVDGTYIAYQVCGDGPDLLLASAWMVLQQSMIFIERIMPKKAPLQK